MERAAQLEIYCSIILFTVISLSYSSPSQYLFSITFSYIIIKVILSSLLLSSNFQCTTKLKNKWFWPFDSCSLAAHVDFHLLFSVSGAKEDFAPPMAGMPGQFPVYLRLPYRRDSYFCFKQQATQATFISILSDCIRHQNQGKMLQKRMFLPPQAHSSSSY